MLTAHRSGLKCCLRIGGHATCRAWRPRPRPQRAGARARCLASAAVSLPPRHGTAQHGGRGVASAAVTVSFAAPAAAGSACGIRARAARAAGGATWTRGNASCIAVPRWLGPCGRAAKTVAARRHGARRGSTTRDSRALSVIILAEPRRAHCAVLDSSVPEKPEYPRGRVNNGPYGRYVRCLSCAVSYGSLKFASFSSTAPDTRQQRPPYRAVERRAALPPGPCAVPPARSTSPRTRSEPAAAPEVQNVIRAYSRDSSPPRVMNPCGVTSVSRDERGADGRRARRAARRPPSGQYQRYSRGAARRAPAVSPRSRKRTAGACLAVACGIGGQCGRVVNRLQAPVAWLGARRGRPRGPRRKTPGSPRAFFLRHHERSGGSLGRRIPACPDLHAARSPAGARAGAARITRQDAIDRSVAVVLYHVARRSVVYGPERGPGLTPVCREDLPSISIKV